MHKHLIALSLCLASLQAQAQTSRLWENLRYKAEISVQAGKGDFTPFWQMSNRYGLAHPDNNSGYLRATLSRDTQHDSVRNWRIGYGADLVVPIRYSSHFVVQQLYGEVQYWALRLSVGQKERPLELKNNTLSSGGWTMGINARPLAQIRLEFPDYYVIKKTHNWLALKGHLAYGWYTDNRWQRDFNAGRPTTTYTTGSIYHSKAGFLRIGNLAKFPLTLTGGIEMVCQFGGTLHHSTYVDAKGNAMPTFPVGSGIKDYLQAFFPSGTDEAIDGTNPNATGNHVGSWHARLDYHGKRWGASVYAEHFFEDHSQLGWDFAWKDMLYGIELNLPSNPFLSTLVYEHIRSTDQSGPVFRSVGSPALPQAIGGVDDYYNHGIYGAYQHAGHVMGSPLVLSPIYNHDNRIYCYDNRLQVHHVGLQGHPSQQLSYRLLYTHTKSLGTYKMPRTNPLTNHYLLVEGSYHPHKVQGLEVKFSYALDRGTLHGDNQGGMLTLSYTGWMNRK